MKYIIIITAIAMLILTACEDNTSGVRYENDSYLILIGSLRDGEPVGPENPVFLGQTIPADGGNLADMTLPETADVVIHDLSNDQSYPLIPFGVVPDTLSGDSLYVYFDPNFMDSGNALIPQPGVTYRIEAVTPTDSVWAETTMPARITLEENAGYTFEFPQNDAGFPTMSYEVINQEHPLMIHSDSGEEHRMLFRFYCLEEFEDQPEYINKILDQPDSPEEPEQYEDPYNGSPRKIRWYNLYKPRPDNGGYVIREAGYKSAFVFYGKYKVSVFSIDENYYKYLYKSEGYDWGGIHNGKGYFGSMSGQEMYTKIIE